MNKTKATECEIFPFAVSIQTCWMQLKGKHETRGPRLSPKLNPDINDIEPLDFFRFTKFIPHSQHLAPRSRAYTISLGGVNFLLLIFSPSVAARELRYTQAIFLS